jgi:phosphohistidine phosphatase
LILMRHATQTGDAVRDHDRPLTSKGCDEAFRVGVRLAEGGPIPEFVLSSTARRCQETWQAVSRGLGSSVPAEFDPGLYNASSRDLLTGIAGIDDKIEVLLVLAHNPGISILAADLAAARDEDLDILGGGFSPASTACFEIEGPWSEISASRARLIRFDRAPRT